MSFRPLGGRALVLDPLGLREPFRLRDFRQLKVWEKAHQLALATYKVTERFPRHELYALTSQMRRAAASVPANIAERCRRGGTAELGRFLRIAMGSASELEYCLLLARDLVLLDDTNYASLAEQVAEVKRMLAPFIQKLTGS